MESHAAADEHIKRNKSPRKYFKPAKTPQGVTKTSSVRFYTQQSTNEDINKEKISIKTENILPPV